MPSFRIIIISIFPRLGSTRESTDHRVTTGNHPRAEDLKSNKTKSGISYSRDYAVEYTMKPTQQDESSFVQLVEIRAVPEELNE